MFMVHIHFKIMHIVLSSGENLHGVSQNKFSWKVLVKTQVNHERWPNLPWECYYNLFLWKIYILGAAAGVSRLDLLLLCYSIISVSQNPPHTAVGLREIIYESLWESMWRVIREQVKWRSYRGTWPPDMKVFREIDYCGPYHFYKIFNIWYKYPSWTLY